jgi:hypothetical protein
MQNPVKHLLLAAILMAFTVSTYAQKKAEDVVFMKNGDSYQGQIIRYQQGETLMFRQTDGTELELNDKDIRKIVQGTEYEAVAEGPQAAAASKNTSTSLRTKGLYNTTTLLFALGSSDANGVSLGAGLGNVTGYMLAPWLGVGLGIGVDNYARRGETVYPVFGELRSYLPSKKTRGFYIALAGGYGLAFERESLDIVEAKGGPMIYPAFGMRLSSIEGLDVNIDFGFKYQEASFTRELFGGDVELRNLTYQRLVLRAGLTLWK